MFLIFFQNRNYRGEILKGIERAGKVLQMGQTNEDTKEFILEVILKICGTSCGKDFLKEYKDFVVLLGQMRVSLTKDGKLGNLLKTILSKL